MLHRLIGLVASRSPDSKRGRQVVDGVLVGNGFSRRDRRRAGARGRLRRERAGGEEAPATQPDLAKRASGGKVRPQVRTATSIGRFRRQYGMTPGAWRCEHCHPGSAPATLKQEMPPQ
jgi:hypothetical protein